MTEERKARLALHKEHCVSTEKKLFDAFQTLSAKKKDMTAADASALAAVAEAMVHVQKAAYY